MIIGSYLKVENHFFHQKTNSTKHVWMSRFTAYVQYQTLTFSSNKTDLGFKTMMKIVFKLLLSSVLIAAIFADEFDSRTKEANYDGYVILPPKMGNSNNCIFF